jgi:hypothetical protein
MTFWTCFECGKYTEIKDTGRHGVPWDCEHKTYTYDRETSDHEDLEKVKPELKDFSASAYPVKNKIVFPLSAITESGLYDVEVGDTLREESEMRRVPDVIEVTGLVRHWDRVELFYEEASEV